MIKSKLRFLLAVMNLTGFLVVVVVNTLATTIPIGGKTTGQISDQYPNLFVPSGITFSIWGIIYILLGIYVVYSLIHAIKRSEQTNDFIERIGILFIITCVANVSWIFSWQYEVLPLSLACMAILLVTLILIYKRLNVGASLSESSEKYLVHLPMSVYLGWISIATIANVTAVLVAYGWDRFGISEQIWAVIMIAIGVLLALIILFSRKDIFFSLVVNWAVIGILIKQTSENNALEKGIIITSIIGICLLSIGILAQIVRRKVYN